MIYLVRFGLVISTLIEPCETHNVLVIDQETGPKRSIDLCLNTSELFYRIVLVAVGGIVLAGHFIALLTEDKLLIGMVLGAEVNYVTVKCHR